MNRLELTTIKPLFAFSGRAYCFDKKDIPSNSKKMTPVISFESKCKPGSPCSKCEGPCDESGDCATGLTCMPGLVKGEFVPGCGGIGFTGT